MNTLQTIVERRSIRKYSGEKVTDEQINELLKAAMYAPSARNTRSWHFIIIKDRSLLNEIPKFHPYSAMLSGASLAVLVCGDLQLEPSPEYNALNCSAATQNLLLAAHALDLGAVWLGVYPRAERMNGFLNLFRLPQHILPINLISIGYSAEEKPAPQRFESGKIHWDKW